MQYKIDVLVGRAGEKPVVILGISSDDQAMQYPLSISEAQQLATSILVSCGISLERFKDAGK